MPETAAQATEPTGTPPAAPPSLVSGKKGPVASKKGEKKAGKVKAPAKCAGPKAKRQSFANCIYKVLKEVHPDTGISSNAMLIMNSYINDILARIAGEASKLAKYNSKNNVSSREVQTAVRLLLPGELAKHALAWGTNAITTCKSLDSRCSPGTRASNSLALTLAPPP